MFRQRLHSWGIYPDSWSSGRGGRLRQQGQLPPGPLTVDNVLMALERLERQSLSQLLLRRELRRIRERTPDRTVE